MKILISRTDNIGDVILTLPLCGWLKQNISNCQIYFLCQKSIEAVVQQSIFVDKICVWNGTLPQVDTIIHVFPNKQIALAARKNKIKYRIGTNRRVFHLFTCNKRVSLSRKNSDLNEAQLNFKLLEGLGYYVLPTIAELNNWMGWKKSIVSSPVKLKKNVFNLVFHIKSRGSAKEWKSTNFLKLARELPQEKFQIIITGTKEESLMIHQEIPEIFDLPNVMDITGKLSLSELIALLEKCEGLIACSTGPLHIASIFQINCLGLYPKKKPMHKERWGAIGNKTILLEEKEIFDDKYLQIPIQKVYDEIMKWI